MMHKCSKCGTEFEGKFCPECGTAWQESKTCPKCGATLGGSAKFCNECGYSFTATKPAEKQPSKFKEKLFAVWGWIKKHLKIVVPSAIGLVFVIVMLSLIPTFILMSVNGTYYAYLNGQFQDDDYIKLSAGKWTDSDGLTGTYKLSGKKITLTYTDKELGDLFGEDATETQTGTVENKVLAVTKDGYTTYYCQKSHKHKYTDTKTLTEPTCADEGVSLGKCACGLTETKSIAATGHREFVNGECTVCGVTELKYELTSENEYFVTGYNSIATKESDIIVLEEYENLPVTGIGYAAFKDYSGLKSIVIPDSVKIIGYSAFFGCSSLTSITIPDSVTSIEFGAFYNTAYYNNKNNWRNNALYIKNHLINVQTTISGEYQIEEGTKTIADHAFLNAEEILILMNTNGGQNNIHTCSGLTNITIPDSVTSIGNGAFWGCSGLTSIVIPNSVTNIGESAFARCNNLTIYCEAENEPSGWDSKWNSDDCPVVWGYKGEE